MDALLVSFSKTMKTINKSLNGIKRSKRLKKIKIFMINENVLSELHKYIASDFNLKFIIKRYLPLL